MNQDDDPTLKDAGEDGQDNDDQRWIETVLKSAEQRSGTVRQALVDALSRHQGSMPLLGLEPTPIEKATEIGDQSEEPQLEAAQIPLLGTNSLKSLCKSSNRRSTQRVCNDLLLRFGSSVAARKSHNSAENRVRGCYGFTPENLPRGICIRGAQFYYRRNVPKDAQGLVGRTEIWRSLRTDSL